MVETEHIGECCPNCGTHHRVIESMPERPLRMSEVESLRESSGVEFCMGVMWMMGDLDTEEDVTEEIVLATKEASRFLSLYGGYGWVVEVESEHRENESPEDVAMEMHQMASQTAMGAMEEAFR